MLEITGSEAFKIPVLTMMYHWLNPTCLDDDVTSIYSKERSHQALDNPALDGV